MLIVIVTMIDRRQSPPSSSPPPHTNNNQQTTKSKQETTHNKQPKPEASQGNQGNQDCKSRAWAGRRSGAKHTKRPAAAPILCFDARALTGEAQDRDWDSRIRLRLRLRLGVMVTAWDSLGQQPPMARKLRGWDWVDPWSIIAISITILTSTTNHHQQPHHHRCSSSSSP